MHTKGLAGTCRRSQNSQSFSYSFGANLNRRASNEKFFGEMAMTGCLNLPSSVEKAKAQKRE